MRATRELPGALTHIPPAARLAGTLLACLLLASLGLGSCAGGEVGQLRAEVSELSQRVQVLEKRLNRLEGGKFGKARGNDILGAESLSVAQRELEASGDLGDVRYPGVHDITNTLLLEPSSIVDEDRDRNRMPLVGLPDAVLDAIVGKPEPALRRRHARGVECLLEEHALGHVFAPQAHRHAERPQPDTGISQMGRNRKPVWPSTDNRHLGRLGPPHQHKPPPVLLRTLEVYCL